ncbi:MAG: hypothetical protein J7621_18100 [Niastella sp.]|nr:hypothetical protein [Niastella sp.]
MKKILYVALLCVTALQLSGRSYHSQSAEQAPASTYFIMRYNWYYDPDLLSYTGSTLTITQEIERLRRIFPEYTFSENGGGGLIEFEYGYFPNQPLRPIYSNLW